MAMFVSKGESLQNVISGRMNSKIAHDMAKLQVIWIEGKMDSKNWCKPRWVACVLRDCFGAGGSVSVGFSYI